MICLWVTLCAMFLKMVGNIKQKPFDSRASFWHGAFGLAFRQLRALRALDGGYANCDPMNAFRFSAICTNGTDSRWNRALGNCEFGES